MKNIKALIGAAVSSAFLVPALALAQDVNLGDGNTLSDVMQQILAFINNWVIPFLIAIAIVIVIWGALEFVFKAGDEDGRKKGREKIIYGIIGIVVMLAVMGLVNFVRNTFGLDGNQEIRNLPQVPTTND